MSGLDLLPEDKRRLHVDGAWSEAEGGARFDVLDPADGSVLASVADGAGTPTSKSIPVLLSPGVMPAGGGR